jgi:hypothetical protein
LRVCVREGEQDTDGHPHVFSVAALAQAAQRAPGALPQVGACTAAVGDGRRVFLDLFMSVRQVAAVRQRDVRVALLFAQRVVAPAEHGPLFLEAVSHEAVDFSVAAVLRGLEDVAYALEVVRPERRSAEQV